MSIDPPTLIHRWFDEVWNQGREETVDELSAPNGICHGLGEGGSDVCGPAGFKVFWRNMRSALPDVEIRIEDTLVDGNKAVVRFVLEGTHLGERLGLLPTGRPFSITGMVLISIDGGPCSGPCTNWYQLRALQQLGASA